MESINAIAVEPSKNTITSFTSAFAKVKVNNKSNQILSCLFNMLNYVDI